MSYKIRRIARSRDKRAEIMLHEVIVQSDVLPLHAETHRITGTDPILPSDIGAETPTGAQAKADAAEARAKAYTDQEVGEVAQELNAHLNDKNNPHNVTPEQIGAETSTGAQAKADAAEARAKAYTDQEIGEVSQALNEHLNDKNNPHNVVPEQIGAETPAGAQAKAEAAAGAALAAANNYTDQEVGEVSQALDAHKTAAAPHSGHALKEHTHKAEDIIGGTIPSGIITMWSGSISNIPKGWVLCDGQNGTPDLRDRFIVGAGKSYNVGDTGGANSVTLTVDNLPAHSHTMGSAGNHSHTGSTNSSGSHTHSYQGLEKGGTEGYGITYTRDVKYLAGEHTTGSAGGHSHSLSINSAGSHTHTINNTGGGKAHENRPPYYALAFIMKI